jgi:multiple sugar transport system substrate-binding protein
LSWLDPNNNKAFLAGEISLTLNGISIYYAAKTSSDPNMKAIAADIQHATPPVGPVGKPAYGGLMFPAFVFRYSKYPNAAKAYLCFMMEREQYEPWQAACIGYVSHPLRAYETNPVWTADPQHVYYRDVVKNMRHTGYAGKPGKEAAAVLADFVVVDMFAEACTGQRTAKEAARGAEQRALRHYRT